MEEAIKFILAGIGLITLINLGVTYGLGIRYDSDIIEKCAGQYSTIEYKKINKAIYCKAGEYKWYLLQE